MDDIAKIQQNVDCSKAHGHVKTIIFKQSMGSGSFPSEWKKGNVVRIHEKEDKQCLKITTVSPLPICGKFFEKLIFDKIFNEILY